MEVGGWWFEMGIVVVVVSGIAGCETIIVVVLVGGWV